MFNPFANITWRIGAIIAAALAALLFVGFATQTIRIVIQEQGSKQAATNIGGIGRAASASEKALGLLKTALAAVGVVALIKQYVDLSNTYQKLLS